MPTPITYLELPSTNVSADKRFYAALFGWTFEDYGPDYAAFSNSGIEGGFNGTGDHQPQAPLPVLQTENIEAMLDNVTKAGGIITMPVFTFPGGRRFHFADPSGNELAVMQAG